MTKYVLKRLLHGLISSFVVVTIVMIMIYTMLDRNLIFATDNVFKNYGNNEKTAYMYRKWEEYGYLDLITYNDYLLDLVDKGELDEETQKKVASIGKKPENDSELTAEYVQKFNDWCAANGYTVTRLNAIMVTPKKYANGGAQQLFAAKDLPVTHRLVKYVTGLISVDNIHFVDEDIDLGKRGLTFTLHDPVYGGDKFAPAIIGNGTYHKYLLYVDKVFPYLHQNLVTINLGKSYAVNAGIDVFDTMTKKQGSYVMSTMTFPTGLTEESADDLHSATFVYGSMAANKVNSDRFTDDYTSVSTYKAGKSKVGYSFTIGIIEVFLVYLFGIPMGILMAKKKDKFVDKLGTAYIVFITAVPSLAYIFLFKAIGGKIGLPTTFDMESTSKLIYVLPIVSLALPAIGNIMKWLRRYMIDQMNSDYVKFARSGGLTEGEIFRKHILKNASIPLVHGIPGQILGALVGAIITERVYTVPGAGNLMTIAINQYDNGVIVGMALFYSLLSVISIIAGDVLISIVDPRISYTGKAR
ncbi:ABC transporter permease [Butyrivibrio sp. VCB2006]|uniref:ABC transporter permease n=1 Tax=Butyrivibrio sp. VCB2006 TaxID=1280679 RepID=UPI00040C16CB|nr:ABC transporter permease [Butyrivibrio sp. VCB2006]